MLHYILQTIAFQVFFLIIYDVFLKNETFFNWNRAYLIGTAFLSFILPFLKFESIKAMVPEPMVVRLPEVIIGDVSPTFDSPVLVIGSQQITEQAASFSWTYVWIVGMVLAALILAYKIIMIGRMLYKNPQRWQGDALIVFLLNSSAAFSFFHYIFLGTDLSAEKKEHILQHEMVHVKEKHSWDLLVFEILRIVFWFNPFIYMYQTRLSNLHEFIADAKAVNYKGKSAYYQSLLSQVFETHQVSFINPFFKQSLTRLNVFGKQFTFHNGQVKKRILMLSKSKSKQIHLIKYALLVPMVMGMLMYTSSYASEIRDPFPVFQNEALNQELSLQELTDKYYKELLAKKDSKNLFSENFNTYFNPGDKQYIQSKQDLAKRQAYMKYVIMDMMAKKEKEGDLTEIDKENYEKRMKAYDTYEDYLEFKKTEKAIESWENGGRDGELRLVVNDIGKLTEAEEKRKTEKLALIKKDDFYYKLNITDGKSSTVLDFGKKDQEEKKKSFESYDVEVPYAVIDQPPLFDGCEASGSKDHDKRCTSDNIAQFVNKNFNVAIAEELNLKGRQRINVIFKIGEDGKVRNVMARAPHPKLEAEAIRVIQSMPNFTPGKQRGEAVTVPYSLPILFQVKDDAPDTNKENTDQSEQDYLKALQFKEQNKIVDETEIPYAVVDEVPIFPSCQGLSSNKERKQCTSDKIASFVNKNFNAKLAKEVGLIGRQRMTVIFKIGIDGTISNIRARANHVELERELIRVIEALPKMQPGKQNGEAVIVPYSLPILFEVQ
ncbi:M56 family metallopeptidase [Gelidibacter japonicus]|uniref:M56 family metallopeptidase n=1 Tax=Gelidibacter japonicus TaxID=1962232 RepID=UPI0020211801|nr:M56 family metallopeptidase [Gelidibacter japonicus]MCL8007197.1 M56 family metallopeptidase [Gelidibacter japonicus]